VVAAAGAGAPFPGGRWPGFNIPREKVVVTE
jgi:hypothetical protein